MHRTLLLVAGIAGCTVPVHEPDDAPAEYGQRYISIGTDAIGTARAVAAQHGAMFDVIESENGVSVIAFDAEDLEELSEQMHEQHHRCGGFILHESLEEARSALHPPLASEVTIDYTLDQAAAVNAVLPALEANRILGTIGELSAMQNRYYQSPSGAAASTWLRDRWRSFTARTDVTIELFDHGYAQQSVILTIPGSTLANEVVVIGGHLDSIAVGGNTSTAPGADDDASGIATLTEITRVLLAKDFRPARTIKVMAYAAEEVGLRGSQGIVRDFKKREVNVVGVLQLDMTNYQGSDKDIWLMKDFTSAAQNTFLTQLIDTYVGATWGLDACGYACSDHASWYRAGVPASMPFESRMKQSNRSIHTRNDTLERSGNNAAHALKFARLGASFAIELGKGELWNPTASTLTTPSDETPACRWTLLGLLLAASLAGVMLAGRNVLTSRW
ncbi:MAG: M20/M25/M40 family metallo-hydrolase [Deltaproteobacteria bacterium]|nr:M20/M25/M40 family metallo-hydrolase [Deltaproteobacteria bacterium]